MSPQNRIRVALVGNPNCGKSTLFNLLTGGKQHVGNYPGVTVDKTIGECSFDGYDFEMVDLPGAYSLWAYSEDEQVTRSFLLKSVRELANETSATTTPFLLVNVLDASNLERNLYFSLQLADLGLPRVVVFNMADIARARGVEFDRTKFSEELAAPVVETVGTDPESVRNVLREIIRVVENPSQNVQITESAVLQELNEAEEVSASGRYAKVAEIYRNCVRLTKPHEIPFSDRLDNVLLHRFWGIPIFLLMMYLVFYLTFTLGAYPAGWLDAGFSWLGDWLGGLWPAGSQSLLKSLVTEGIIGGVGGVIIFLPNIIFLFLAIALLEDSGYMSRAAFLMDRFMSRLGLPGKSFIPMLVGFGCSVPGILSTRILENRRERLATMFVVPLMSCGARLPIYALMIPAFFAPAWRAPVLWALYFIGILLAVALAKLLRGTILKGEPLPFIMELPPYHVPAMRTVGCRTFERGWMYLRKAGTVILGFSILLWCLTTFPRLPEEVRTNPEISKNVLAERALEHSFAGRLGRGLEPVLRPMGFDWKIGTALVGATAAKEIFVAQIGIVYRMGSGDAESPLLRDKIRAAYDPLTGFCVMLFCLIGLPCMATVAVTARESGSWRWAAAQWLTLTTLAWILTTLVYQIGSFFHVGV